MNFACNLQHKQNRIFFPEKNPISGQITKNPLLLDIMERYIDVGASNFQNFFRADTSTDKAFQNKMS